MSSIGTFWLANALGERRAIAERHSTEVECLKKLENWHSQRGPRCRACHFDLDLWPFDPKIYRCLPFFILHLCMKYEVCRSNTVRVIALQRNVDRRTDRQTDGQTDKVITIGLPHLWWRGPKYWKTLKTRRFYITLCHRKQQSQKKLFSL